MCGRLFGNEHGGNEKVLLRFNLNRPAIPIFLNAAPTDNIPVIHRSSTGYKINPMRWSLSPVNGSNTHLARIETVLSRTTFWQAAQKRRGVVPVHGFIEWKDENGIKQPYYFSSVDNEPIYLAAIWDILPTKNLTCAIITQPANAVVAKIHDRMPLILNSGQAESWMSLPNNPEAFAVEVARSQILLSSNPVSTAINNSRNKIAAVAI